MPRRLETQLEGLVLIEADVYRDERGFLVESFRDETWAGLGVEAKFVQQNSSRSLKSTLRGIHFQTRPGQAKLVRCSRGEIFDVAVDLRPGSATFGQWEGHRLDDRSHHQIYIPVGFGHGFCVISEVADVSYQLSSYYDPETEAGLAWDDPDIAIEWPVSEPLLSERDRSAPGLSEVAAARHFA